MANGTVVLAKDTPLWRVQPGTTLYAPDLTRGPIHRFDDPHKQFYVYYTADSPLCALLEMMDWLRNGQVGLRTIAAVPVDPDDPPVPTPDQRIAAVLAGWHLIKLSVKSDQPVELVDINDDAALLRVDDEQEVRNAFEAMVTHKVPPVEPASVHLDQSYIRMGNPLARPLTQAAGGAVRSALGAGLSGLAFRTRHSHPFMVCHAFWADRVQLVVDEVQPLSPGNSEHESVVKIACDRLGLPHPAGW